MSIPLDGAASKKPNRRARKRGDGEGSIYQRNDGLWVASLRIGVGSNGHPDRRKVSGKTRAEAQRKLDELRGRVANGLIDEPNSERITVGEYLDHWLHAIEGSVRPRTWESYGQLVRLHLRPALGHIKLAALRPSHLQKLYAIKRNEGLAPRTVQYLHAIMHRALGQA